MFNFSLVLQYIKITWNLLFRSVPTQQCYQNLLLININCLFSCLVFSQWLIPVFYNHTKSLQCKNAVMLQWYQPGEMNNHSGHTLITTLTAVITDQLLHKWSGGYVGKSLPSPAEPLINWILVHQSIYQKLWMN